MNKMTDTFGVVINNIHDYLKKSPWKERYKEYFDYYLNLFSESIKLSRQEFITKIDRKDEHIETTINGMVTETFLEAEYGENADTASRHENISEEFLKRRKWKLSKEAIHFLEEMKDRSFSIYEIVDVDPGKSVTIRDILLNTKEIKVNEVSGSKYAKPFEFLVSKVVEMDGEYFFTGVAFKIPFLFAEKIKKQVRKELKANNLDLKKYELVPKELCPAVYKILRKFTPDLFVEGINYMLNPPKMVNTEGEELKLIEVKFIVRDKAEVIKKLDMFADLVRIDDDYAWDWIGPKMKITKGNKGLVIFAQDQEGNILRGHIDLKGDKLVCILFSEEKAKKLITSLINYLDDSISLPVIEQEDIFSQENKLKHSLIEREEKDKIPEAMEQKIVCEFFEKHMKESLEEKIHVLNNKTPRQCAKTDPKRLVRWLKLMEENAKEQGCDINWVWDELGMNRSDWN